MTTPATERRDGPYACNGSLQAFDFNFKVFSEDDIDVVREDTDGAETTLTKTTHYTVSLNADQDNNPGGTITTVSTYATGNKITIIGSLAYSQTTQLNNLGGYFPKVIEKALDRLAILIQQLLELANRTIKFPASDSSAPTLPASSVRASKVFGFDADGDPTMLDPNVTVFSVIADSFTATAGQTVFTLSRSYVPGVHAIRVFVNGLHMRVGVDYTESSATQITFASGLTVGDLVEVVAGVPVTSGSASDSALISHTPAGTGAVATNVKAKLDQTVSVKDFGAVGDGSTDDTAAFNLAIAAAKSGGKKLFIPKGQYKVVSTLTSIDGQFEMFGEGMQESEILFIPTANDVCVDVSNGADRAERVCLHDFAIKSTDTTYTKVALDLYDLSMCQIERIFIWGSGGSGVSANTCWSGNNSIGIRTHGREATSVRDVEIIADRPIVIAANPNTDADDGEDMDHWNWQNLYLVGNGNPLIEVDAGLGIMEVEFGGYQAWVGGTNGFKINDTRATPVVPSRGIKFKNVRREQGTSAAAYVFDMTFTASIQTVKFENVLMANGTNGIKLSGFERAVLDQVTGAATSGTSLLTAGATAASVLVMRGCIWTTGGAVTTTGLTQIHAQAYRSASYAAPSDAVYAGQITDTIFNVGKARITGVNGVTGFVITGTTGDGLQIIPEAAGSGASIRAVNNAESDFEPLTLTFETLVERYRTGAGTTAVAKQIDTAGQTAYAKRMFPAQDTGAVQTAAGLFAGTGAPNNANGSNGDFYLRGDGTAAGNTVIYHKEGGAWVALVTT